MPEELQGVGVRRASHANPSEGTRNTSDQFTQHDRRTPEMLARALLRARNSIQNKENITPEKPGRRRRRQRRMVSTSRSPLPSDYRRAPLQDITVYMQIIQRRTRITSTTQIYDITPLRQPTIRYSPVQEESPQEGPLQGMDTAMINAGPVPEATLQETETAITNPTLVPEGALQGTEIAITNLGQIPESTLVETESRSLHLRPIPQQEVLELIPQQETELQNLAAERTLGNQVTAESGLGHLQENKTRHIGATNTSNLANQEHGRAFGNVLQSQLWNERSGRDNRGGRRQQKKSSLKPLMKMR